MTQSLNRKSPIRAGLKPAATCALLLIAAMFAPAAYPQNTLVTNTFKTPEGKTPAQANLKSSATIGATPIYGKAYFRATDVAGNVVREFELGGVTYAGEVLGFIKSDGTLISYAETAGVVLVPLTSALPSGLAYCLELQWNGSTDGRVAPTTLKGKNLCKIVPDTPTAVWANLATASLTSPSYGYQTGLAGAVLSPGNWTCVTAASVPTPLAGFVNLFCDSSNGNKYSRKNSDGSVTVLEGGTVPTGTGVRKVVAGVEDAAASLIVNADVSATAAIVDTKLAQIVTASKVSGAAITLLTSLPAGAGNVPIANLPDFSGIGACGANTWASTLNDNAAPTCTQPGFSNLSGSIAIGQTQLTTRGDLWSVNSLGNLYRLAIGTNDQVLATNGLDPVWASITDAMVPNTITIDQATLALTGDSATAFFSAGQIEAARGGTGIDSSASTGVLRVNAGTWTTDAGIANLTTSTSASLRNVLSDEFGTTGVFVSFDTTGAATNDVFCVTGASTAGVCTSSTPVNNQTGVSYTFVTGDRGKLVTFSNAGAVAVTLPQAGASFPSGWFTDAQNRGAGTVTITPTTSTIDGAASLTLKTDDGVMIVSDGTNYFTQRGRLRTITDADVPDNITASNYVPLTRTLTGGTGIAAIGDLSADRTIAIDATEIATTTFGANADFRWNFNNLGATDPYLDFTGGVVTLGGTLRLETPNELRNANAGKLIVAGQAPDGATAVGVSLNANAALTVAGSVIAEFNNAGVRKSAVDKDGGFSGNAASATALAADPADCSANQFANAINASGTLTCAALTLAGAQFANQGTTTTVLHGNAAGNPSWGAVSLTADVSGVLPEANGGFSQKARLTGDLTSTVVTFADATGLSFSVAANTTYQYEFHLIYQTAATTTGIAFGMNGPASPTSIVGEVLIGVSLTGTTVRYFRAYDSGAASASIDTANADTHATVRGTFVNGANAGTLIVRFASEVGGSTVTLKAGSNGTLTVMP